MRPCAKHRAFSVQPPNWERLVASVHRRCLGARGWKSTPMLTRDTFVNETRRKPLARRPATEIDLGSSTVARWRRRGLRRATTAARGWVAARTRANGAVLVACRPAALSATWPSIRSRPGSRRMASLSDAGDHRRLLHTSMPALPPIGHCADPQRRIDRPDGRLW